MLAQPELKKLRLDVCETCEFRKEQRPKLSPIKLDICTRCGCILEAKARVLYTSCPEGKWEKACLDFLNEE